jgi:micrococcal nuclease
MTDREKAEWTGAAKYWPATAGLLFVIFAFRGEGLAAVLFAASGLTAVPHLNEAFARYGARAPQRAVIAVGAAILGLAVHLLLPDSTAPQEPDNAAAETTPEQQAGLESAPENGIDPGEDRSIGPAPTDNMDNASVQAAAQVSGCSAIDGDTLDCSGEKIRLLGIDAPEMPGHCRVGRECAPGDPYASKASLQSAIQFSMQITRVGVDHYGRTLAMVYANGENLSCIQLRSSQSLYIADWDNGGQVASECPVARG